MKVSIDINLTDDELKLLNEIDISEEPDTYSFDLDGVELESLFEKGLVDSVMGEQFYLTLLGSEYLKQKDKK